MYLKYTISLGLIIALCLIKAVISWPSGAPESTCESLLPKHGNNQPKPGSASPFVLTQSHQDYGPGDRVKVTVTAPRGISFKGLIVQGYDPQTNRIIGSFQSGRGLKTIDSCGAVTHTDRKGKRSAVLLWQAPSSQSGRVAFRATVVQRFSEFYYGLNPNIDPNV